MGRMKKAGKALLLAALFLAAFALVWLYLQFVFAHRSGTEPFLPGYPREELGSILAKPALSRADYETLYTQTGLGPAAVDELLDRGKAGRQQILDTQEAFFVPPAPASCSDLGITTREHRFLDESGKLLYAAPLAPLKEGDILVSFSTHTAGWRHGHAGLVVDPERGGSLESVVLGSLSDEMNVDHWRSYTTMMVLRPKADDETRHKVVQLARETLMNIPYSLVSGVFGDKLQPLSGPHSAHCGYLPWYAWMAVGLDLDGDGGRVVAPEDLALSPNVEVVQLYGIDPARFPLSFPDP